MDDVRGALGEGTGDGMPGELLGALLGPGRFDPLGHAGVDCGGHRRRDRAVLVDEVDNAQLGELGQRGDGDAAQRLLGVEGGVELGGGGQQQLEPAAVGPHPFEGQVAAPPW